MNDFIINEGIYQIIFRIYAERKEEKKISYLLQEIEKTLQTL